MFSDCTGKCKELAHRKDMILNKFPELKDISKKE